MPKTKTTGDIQSFINIASVVGKELGLPSNFYLKKSHYPLYVDAFRLAICLSLNKGLSGAEISRITGRNLRGIYRQRNKAYSLLDRNTEFKCHFIKLKEYIRP